MTEKSFVRHLIRERANARRERDAARETRGEASIVYVPFQAYLLWTLGVADWRSMKRYDLWNAYLDYQLDCVRYNVEFEHPQNYGLTNVL